MKATFQVIAFFTFIWNLLNAQTISLSSSTLQVEENLPSNEVVGTIIGGYDDQNFTENVGELVWKTSMGISGHPALSRNGKIVYAPSGAGLYAVNVSDGSIKWSFTESRCYTPLVGNNGNVYCGHQTIYCLDGETGEKIWEFNSIGAVGGFAQSSNNVLYFGAGQYGFGEGPGTVYALNSDDGSLVWKHERSGFTPGRPSISEKHNMVLVAWEDWIYAYNADTGAILWSGNVDTNNYLYPPAIDEGTDLFYHNSYNIVSALLESGNTNASWNWSLRNFAGEEVIQSPVISSDGNIIFGKYYSLNSLGKTDGTTNWTTSFTSILPSHQPASTPSLGSDGTIYIGSKYGSPGTSTFGGGLHAFDSSTGDLKWSYQAQGWIESSPLITNEGLIIFGNQYKNSHLYAVQGSSSPEINAPWPTYGQNNRRNGRVESKDFTFSLTPPSSQNNNSLFNLESNGTLTTASTFDYETTPTLTIEVNATDYLGDSVIQTFTVQIQDVPSTSLVENDLLVKAENLYPNWYTSEWFGTFYVPTFPTNWIYHAELGWTYIHIVSDNSYWMYSKLKNNTEELGWLWTTDELFPYLYYNAQSRWLYYFKGLNQPTFFDYEDNAYIYAVE
jgi:outer membrane protein assembly factor BamB